MGLALDMALKFYISAVKGLKLKVQKILGLIPRFVEVAGKKTGRDLFTHAYLIGLREDLTKISEWFAENFIILTRDK